MVCKRNAKLVRHLWITINDLKVTCLFVRPNAVSDIITNIEQYAKSQEHKRKTRKVTLSASSSSSNSFVLST